jgi:phytanoyl-CoA hydroxylase
MIALTTPRGLPVRVPEMPSEDPSPRFAPHETAEIKAYYREMGYVIVKSVFSAQTCDEQRRLWDAQVKPFSGNIYRQATGKVERHVLNSKGWVMNPILNLQSVDPRRFGEFRDFATRSVLTAPRLRDLFIALLGEAPKIVQSMYFEGNSATWEHQDSYYLDSEHVGQMAAAWIALEEIAARAGRFFICPGSHRIRLDDHSITNNIAEHHEVYIASVVDRIRALHLEIRAPIMDKGDVLFWNALTIHGSLDSQDPARSRSSITCHAIPNSRLFLQWQVRLKEVSTENIAGTFVHRPKDLAQMKNRLVFMAETAFPSLFYRAKSAATKKLIKFKSRRSLPLASGHVSAAGTPREERSSSI